MKQHTPPPIRPSLAVAIVVVLYLVWLIGGIFLHRAHGATPRPEGTIAGTAALGTPSTPGGKHCGCFAGKKQCAEPCSECCGPNGYFDCFKPGMGNDKGTKQHRCEHAR